LSRCFGTSRSCPGQSVPDVIRPAFRAHGYPWVDGGLIEGGRRVTAVALDDSTQGAVEKDRLTGTVTLPVPGGTATTNSFVPPVVVSEPAIDEPAGAFAKDRTTVNSQP
jgi:hypothetical protein